MSRPAGKRAFASEETTVGDSRSSAEVTIDATLAALPPAQRAAMQDVRAIIARVAVGAEEAISYGAPAFRYQGRALVAYAASKHHCSFFPMSPELIERHADELAGYDTAKGTIRFTPDHPIPPALIEQIVRERLVQIDAM